MRPSLTEFKSGENISQLLGFPNEVIITTETLKGINRASQTSSQHTIFSLMKKKSKLKSALYEKGFNVKRNMQLLHLRKRLYLPS